MRAFEKVYYGVIYETGPGTIGYLAKGGGWSPNINEAAFFEGVDDAYDWMKHRPHEETNGTSVVKISVKVEAA